LEPAKESFAGGVGEGPGADRFANSGGLADDHNFTQNWSTGNGRRNNARTTPAFEKPCDMSIEGQLLTRRGHQRWKISVVGRPRTTRNFPASRIGEGCAECTAAQG
jgi:hypothetical protein